jgi:tRNA-Thr(GGU) m(6)t(6)A37 methyltransferase TsaA
MPGDTSETHKLAVLLGYWIEHNREHIAENKAWMKKAENAGMKEVADRLKKAVELSEEANHHMEHAREGVEAALGTGTNARPVNRRAAHGRGGGHAHPAGSPSEKNDEHRRVHRHIEFHQIGTIRTPYRDRVPRSTTEEKGDEVFTILVNEEFREGLEKLGSFSYIYVLFYLDRPIERSDRPIGPSDRTKRRVSMIVAPPKGGGVEVGVFSSRSPDRPNPIGLSVVRVLGVSANVVRISSIDVLDETPLLDIKPYFGSSDSKPDAGDGWLGDVHTAK